MKRVIIVILAAAGLIAAVIAARKMAVPVVWQVAEVQPIDAPAAATGSAQPQLSVQGDTLLLSWIELINADATLKFAERTSTGWSPARKVSAGRDWFVNWADVPSVVRLADDLSRHIGSRKARPARTPTTSASRFRETRVNHGRRRHRRTTTARRPNMGLPRCSKLPARVSASSGSMDGP